MDKKPIVVQPGRAPQPMILDKIQIPTRPVAMGVAIGGREKQSSPLPSASAAVAPELVLVQEYSLRVPKLVIDKDLYLIKFRNNFDHRWAMVDGKLHLGACY